MPLPNDAFWTKEDEDLGGFLFPLLMNIITAGLASGFDLADVEVSDLEELNRQAAYWSAQHSTKLAGQLNNTTRNVLEKKYNEWYLSGDPIDVLFENIESVFNDNRAENIAVTEVTLGFSLGVLLAWGVIPQVDGKEWVTSNDDKVCPICGPMHGQRVRLDEFFIGGDGAYYFSPPAHNKCRCGQKAVKVRNGF